jgi:hypothetical protein
MSLNEGYNLVSGDAGVAFAHLDWRQPSGENAISIDKRQKERV